MSPRARDYEGMLRPAGDGSLTQEPSGTSRNGFRKEGLGNTETHQVTWRPEELRFRAATDKREEGDVTRTELLGQELQERLAEVRSLGWKKGPFLLSWNKWKEGKKGVLFRADHLALTMPAGTLFSLWKRVILHLGRVSQL